jgi:hypothetical protein
MHGITSLKIKISGLHARKFQNTATVYFIQYLPSEKILFGRSRNRWNDRAVNKL